MPAYPRMSPYIFKESVCMKLCIIGTGYVGLVSAACFAEMGNTVTCVDVNPDVVARLRAGQVHIYEPGLEEMVKASHADGRLSFTTELAEGLKGADMAFICVGTPPDEDGSADLKYVLQVADSIGQLMENDLVVVDKSTVPVGTAKKVAAAVQKRLDERGAKFQFEVVSNPEFLKEGAAISDFMKPDRVVIGTSSQKAADLMRELYAPFARTRGKLIVMGVPSAEMTKYAANCMLATKISFINEIAGICEHVGADVRDVRTGIGSDSRIGYQFIYPGVGYGGSRPSSARRRMPAWTRPCSMPSRPSTAGRRSTWPRLSRTTSPPRAGLPERLSPSGALPSRPIPTTCARRPPSTW